VYASGVHKFNGRLEHKISGSWLESDRVVNRYARRQMASAQAIRRPAMPNPWGYSRAKTTRSPPSRRMPNSAPFRRRPMSNSGCRPDRST